MIDTPATSSASRALAALIEVPFTPRGLPVAFLLVAAALVLPGWLRPPLSRDISALHLPLGLWHATDSETVPHSPRGVPFDSVGVPLLVLIGTGVVIVLRRSRRLSRVAGMILGAAIAANATIALNHPALIESLDDEYAQRMQMAAMIAGSPVPNALTQNDNDRTGLAGAPAGDEQPADLTRGWVHLGYGRWLVLWSVAGYLFASQGALRKRLAHCAAWSAAGVGLGALFCSPRLLAECHWCLAKRFEMACQYPAARRALDQAIAIFPEFERLERTWLLAGKLDHRAGKPTDQERFFRAYQLARRKDQPRAVAYHQDLPWLLVGAYDYRNGLQTPPAGLNRTFPTGTIEIETPDHQRGLPPARGAFYDAYLAAQGNNTRQALSILDDLARIAGSQPAVRNRAARLWTDVGLLDYLQDPVPMNSGYDYFAQNQSLVGAQTAWQWAARLAPSRHDWHFYLGSLAARLDPANPERTEALMGSLVNDLGDPILRADVLATLGDAWFDAGQGGQARRRYADSFKAFLLPKMINYRAQKNLGGL